MSDDTRAELVKRLRDWRASVTSADDERYRMIGEAADFIEALSRPAPTGDDADHHLGMVLLMMQDLHPDDQCKAFVNAVAFYNARHPDSIVAPSDFGYRHYPLPDYDRTLSSNPVEGWRPIETAPTCDENWKADVLVIGGRYTEATKVPADGEYWRYSRSNGHQSTPTHWMKLPAPPSNPITQQIEGK